MTFIRLLIAVNAFASVPIARAEAPTTSTTPSPLYSSAFADYRPYEDAQVGNWRAQNDGVRAAAAARQSAGVVQPPNAEGRASAPGQDDHAKQHGGGK